MSDTPRKHSYHLVFVPGTDRVRVEPVTVDIDSIYTLHSADEYRAIPAANCGLWHQRALSLVLAAWGLAHKHGVCPAAIHREFVKIPDYAEFTLGDSEYYDRFKTLKRSAARSGRGR